LPIKKLSRFIIRAAWQAIYQLPLYGNRLDLILLRIELYGGGQWARAARHAGKGIVQTIFEYTFHGGSLSK
jgi:hypothetical protein